MSLHAPYISGSLTHLLWHARPQVISMGFHVQEAIPLSHVGVFGSVFAQNLVNLPRRHPLSSTRPLVDAEIALLLMPCMLLGHTLGVLIGPRLPEVFIEVVAVIVLLFASLKTFHAAWKAFQREIAAGRKLPRLGAIVPGERQPSSPANLSTPGQLLPPPATLPPPVPPSDRTEALGSGETTDGIKAALLRSDHVRSDAWATPDNAPGPPDASEASPTPSAMTPFSKRGVWSGQTTDDGRADEDELVDLAHAPRGLVRQRLADRNSWTNFQSDVVACQLSPPISTHMTARTPTDPEPRTVGSTLASPPASVTVLLREYPQPIDGGSVLMLLVPGTRLLACPCPCTMPTMCEHDVGPEPSGPNIQLNATGT